MRPIDLLLIEFFFDSANRFAGFDGSRTGDATYPSAKRPCGIAQVGICSGKYLAFHMLIIADFMDTKN